MIKKQKQYKKYKPSGIEWIGDVPEHWELTRMSNIGDFSKGRGISKAQLTEEGVFALLYGDIYTKYNIVTNKLLRKTSLKVAANSVEIYKGDLLLTASGETREDIGKCVLYNSKNKAYAGGDVIIFRQKKHNSLFLSYLFNSAYFKNQKAALSKGQIVVHIYSAQLRRIVFALPPLQEQTAIANYLDRQTTKIDQLTKNLQQQILQLQEIRKIEINNAVTKGLNKNVSLKPSGIEWIGDVPEHWEVRRLKQNAYLKGRIGWQNLRTEEFIEIGPYCVTGTDFKDGQINWETCYHVSEERYAIDEKIQLVEGDLLITKDGTIGKVARVINIPYKATLNSGIMLIRPTNNTFHTHFFYWVLNSGVFHFYNEYTASGSTIKHLYQNVFERMAFTVPPLKEQTAIANYLDTRTAKIDQLIKNKKEQIGQLKEMRNAIINDAVTGKIDLK